MFENAFFAEHGVETRYPARLVSNMKVMFFYKSRSYHQYDPCHHPITIPPPPPPHIHAPFTMAPSIMSASIQAKEKKYYDAYQVLINAVIKPRPLHYMGKKSAKKHANFNDSAKPLAQHNSFYKIHH